MGMLATLWVTLGLKKEGFDRGAKESKDKIKEVGTEAEKTGTKVDEVGKKGTKSFGPAMLLGAVVAVFVAVKQLWVGMKDLYNSFGEQERASNSLAQALRNNGKDVDTNLRKYEAFASEMQRLTNTGDELVMELLKVAETMRAADPMQAVKGAIALSKAFGIDMTTGIRMATLAQEGNFTMLARYVPALRTANGVAEQTAIYQKAIADGFNLATEEAKDSIGVTDRLKNSWGDLKEVFGEVIATPMKNFFTGLAEWIEDVNLILTTKSIPAWQRWLTTITGIGAETIRAQRAIDDEEERLSNENIKRLKEEVRAQEDYSALSDASLKSMLTRTQEFAKRSMDANRERAMAIVELLSEEISKRKQAADKQLEIEVGKAERLEEIKNKEAAGLQELIDGLAAYVKGSENYYNQLIAINDKRIKNLTGGEIRDSLIAENQELKNQIYLLGLSAEKRAELASQSVAPERMTAIGTPSVTGGVTPRGMPNLEMSEGLKKQGEELKSQYDKMVEDAAQFGAAFGQAIDGGLIAGLNAMAQSIGETGKIDFGAVVGAILNPLGDMAITTGVLALGIGKAIAGIKASLMTLTPVAAIAAGAALIAIGVAAKAGAAAIGSGGSGGGGYSGGQTSVSGSMYREGTQKVEIVGVIKKGDIYLSNQKETLRRAR